MMPLVGGGVYGGREVGEARCCRATDRSRAVRVVKIKDIVGASLSQEKARRHVVVADVGPALTGGPALADYAKGGGVGDL